MLKMHSCTAVLNVKTARTHLSPVLVLLVSAVQDVMWVSPTQAANVLAQLDLGSEVCFELGDGIFCACVMENQNV